ncbi:hypothetical protein Pmani_035709 [Petrolisthes manimaculis]|uniref:Uncharacterized protein n=1 Tax=Petrolisthes manimaculis TaxID=1843537 RepID=A0AAE1NJZ8_9EUCA|nr:hypothetical protein Pmani_035709 [Petrolisthes manimaculis]
MLVMVGISESKADSSGSEQFPVGQSSFQWVRVCSSAWVRAVSRGSEQFPEGQSSFQWVRAVSSGSEYVPVHGSEQIPVGQGSFQEVRTPSTDPKPLPLDQRSFKCTGHVKNQECDWNTLAMSQWAE